MPIPVIFIYLIYISNIVLCWNVVAYINIIILVFIDNKIILWPNISNIIYYDQLMWLNFEINNLWSIS